MKQMYIIWGHSWWWLRPNRSPLLLCSLWSEKALNVHLFRLTGVAMEMLVCCIRLWFTSTAEIEGRKQKQTLWETGPSVYSDAAACNHLLLRHRKRSSRPPRSAARVWPVLTRRVERGEERTRVLTCEEKTQRVAPRFRAPPPGAAGVNGSATCWAPAHAAALVLVARPRSLE